MSNVFWVSCRYYRIALQFHGEIFEEGREAGEVREDTVGDAEVNEGGGEDAQVHVTF